MAKAKADKKGAWVASRNGGYSARSSSKSATPVGLCRRASRARTPPRPCASALPPWTWVRGKGRKEMATTAALGVDRLESREKPPGDNRGIKPRPNTEPRPQAPPGPGSPSSSTTPRPPAR